MRNIHCLNNISAYGTDLLTDDYQLVDDLTQAEGVLVRSAALHDTAFPESLQAIARAGAGVNNIPLDRCAEEGIVVFNTPGANANAVKEIVVCGLMLGSRDIAGGIAWCRHNAADENIAKAAEKAKKAFAGREVKGKKLGVIGLGAIGAEVANIAIDLGMDVYGYDPYVSVGAAWRISSAVHHVTNLDDIFRTCDYMTIHVPAMEGTIGTIDERACSLMKDGAVFLNFSRDTLVDNAAMAAALSTWNDKLAEIWSLLTESPQTFKGGQVWGVMTGIHGALQAIGYGLLVLFFAVGVMKTCGSFVEVKKPEHALKLFIRFALAKGAVAYGLELMLAVFSIVQGMVSTIITQSGSSGMSSVSLPQELIDAINNVGFWDSIPLWAVTLIGGLLITVLSFTMILTVYGRMFSLWMYAAIAPIPLSTFAGEPTSSVGKNFIRSYAGVCLQGVVIALSCIIFSAISSSPPAVDTGASVVTAVWTYVGELAFNLLVLVGAIKGCDRIVKEIMGL